MTGWAQTGLLCALLAPALAADVTRRGTSDWSRGAETVAVTGEALVHTAQVLATDSATGLVRGSVDAQTAQVLENLHIALSSSGSRLADVVKLNLYVRPGVSVESVIQVVQRRFPAEVAPAVSLVETNLPIQRALVGADAVATAPAAAVSGRVVIAQERLPGARGGIALSSRLAPGPRAYISGQAGPGDDVESATLESLDLLRRNLEFLGLGLSDAAQLTVFLKPMSSAPSVAESIARFFGGQAPPLSFVEWSNAQPIEIEMIAAASATDTASTEPARYLTPPGEKASPVFCRIVRVDHPTTIYFSSVRGDAGTDEPAQIRSAFERLAGASDRAGTDLRHLVKATYYVTTDAIGQTLTDIGKGIYDPARRPAAPKATVRGIGVAGGVFTMDMIAVPAMHVESEVDCGTRHRHVHSFEQRSRCLQKPSVELLVQRQAIIAAKEPEGA